MLRHRLLSWHWIAGHALAATLVTVFMIAGFWQLERLEQQREINSVRIAREAMEPLRFGADPAASLLADDPATADGLTRRHAVATGEYVHDMEILRRSRTYGGAAGWHVLTPLSLEGGEMLLIDRGWVPYDQDSPPVEIAAPPAGTVTVTGHLEATMTPPVGFGASFAPRDPESGPVRATFYVDLPRLEREQMPGLLRGAWLQLHEQEPAQAGDFPLPAMQEAELDEGPHLGYAFQWFSFAAVGIVGYWFLMRRVLAEEKQARDGKGERGGE